MDVISASVGGGWGSPDEILELIRRTRRIPAHPSRLGRHDVFVELMQFGRGVVTSVYEIRADRVVVVRAVEGSYREDVAVELFDVADEVASTGEFGTVVHVRPIRVEGFALDRAVVLGPGGNNLFADMPVLAARAIGVFAVHRSEIVDGEDHAAFWFTMSSKGLGLSANLWSRQPRPRADIWLLDDWPGGPFQRSRRLTPCPAEHL